MMFFENVMRPNAQKANRIRTRIAINNINIGQGVQKIRKKKLNINSKSNRGNIRI